MKLDLHVHTHYSSNKTWRIDAVGSPAQIIAQAHKSGLDGIAITDHDTVKGALEALAVAQGMKDFVVIPGVEVSSAQGHILALGVREDVPAGLTAAETIKKIHALGGIAVASHPYAGFPRKSLGDAILKERFDAVEAWNSRTSKHLNGKAETLCRANNIPCVANSDAHHWKDVGTAYTEIDGSDPLSAIKNGQTKLYRGRMSWIQYGRLFPAKFLRNIKR